MERVKDYGQDVESIKQFLKEFSHVDHDDQVTPKYVPTITRIANREAICLQVELADLEQFDQVLAEKVRDNAVRYNELFYQALDELIPQFKTSEPAVKDIMDVFIEQRLFVAERNSRANQNNPGSAHNAGPTSQTNDPTRNRRNDIDGQYPPDLIRRSEVYFKPSTMEATPVRHVKAEQIGKLITVRGIVTRATDVKPRITIATYTCDQCGCETFQPVTGIDFTPLFECTSAACKASKNVGRITFQMRGSKFVKYQEIKLQEHSDQVPTGHIPRTITVTAHGEQTRLCVAGDHISLTGVFLPIKRTGFGLRGAGLTADTYINAHYITKMNKTEDDHLNNEPYSPEEGERLIRENPEFISKLSRSIAPEIYGNDELKKALLLLLVGGVDKTTYGLKIRGNINICIMGDPGVAKSQLLIFIDRLAPRSQYTTGRGSSGVGLTAAVLKDPITNELVLEGGALVLADQGICCIDEFDKMMDADRTAIHEVMEQQTVSIAKAGIMTTLNARVSILAAANPVYGRFNEARSLSDNLQLPPALLSRFDLLWLLRDKPDIQRDLELAEHVTTIHANPTTISTVENDVFDMQTMRRYISLCKTKQPVVPEKLSDKLVKIYLGIRQKGREKKTDALFTSPRSLLAIIRLASAFARLRLADEVDEADIQAAHDIYAKSRESIEGNAVRIAGVYILDIIKHIATTSRSVTIPKEDLVEALKMANHRVSDLESTLNKLDEFDSINYDRETGEITLIDSWNVQN